MNLHGPVRASETAGSGVAHVTISFAAWKEGQVADSKHELVVDPPKPGPKLEAVSSRLVKTLVHPDRKANVSDVRFFADGTKLFAAGYPSGIVQIFDVASGKEIRRIETPPGYRGSADYAIPTPDFATMFVPIEGRKLVRYENDGKKLSHWTYNGELLCWDLASGKQLPSLKATAPGRGLMAAYMSPDAHTLVTQERVGGKTNDEAFDELILWDLRTRIAKSLGNGSGMAAFSSNGHRLALSLFASKTEPGRLVLLDAMSGRETFRIDAKEKNQHSFWPLFSPDDKILAVERSVGRINLPATIQWYDVTSTKELASFSSGGEYPFMASCFSPDGLRLAAADYDGGVTVWNVPAKKVEWVHRSKDMGLGRHAVFSPDGKTLAVVAQAKMDPADRDPDPDPADLPQPRVFLFDVARGGEPEVMICPNGYTGGIAFSPDGKRLAVGGAGGVFLFDLGNR